MAGPNPIFPSPRRIGCLALSAINVAKRVMPSLSRAAPNLPAQLFKKGTAPVSQTGAAGGIAVPMGGGTQPSKLKNPSEEQLSRSTVS